MRFLNQNDVFSQCLSCILSRSILIVPLMLSLMNSAPWISTDLYIFVLLLNATNKAGKCQVILFLSVKILFIESECEVTR